MNFFTAIRVALDALLVNKGRTMLTSLGIVIGITAVIAMVAAGSGARAALDDRLDSVGKTLILIRPESRTRQGVGMQPGKLTAEDVAALQGDPDLKRWLTGVAESQHAPTIASTPATGRNHGTTITGCQPIVKDVRNWHMRFGRFVADADVKQASAVCVLGETIRQRLFPNQKNPTGEQVRLSIPATSGNPSGQLVLRVVGILEPKGRAPTGSDQDDQVFIPIPTLLTKLGQPRHIDVIVTSARTVDLIKPATARIERILRDTHRLRPDAASDFDVSSVEEMAKVAVIVTKTLTILIVIIASISLIVGGIGIMNIMLVSVTERTREIGIRMAVGAKPRDVRNQFLIEAITLALMGGIIGVSLGIGVAMALKYFTAWPVAISPWVVALAFGVSAATGVFFGYYPAVKASRLDPIEALRYE